MRILVTGNRGYIGSVMAPYLLKKGHEIVGLDNALYADDRMMISNGGFHQIDKDIRDVEAKDLAGFDGIIHLAGLSNDPLGEMNPALTYEINHTAALRFARLAKEAKTKRFLFSSSCSLYGAAGEEIVDERSETCPITAYGKSKLMFENDLMRLADTDFSPTLMRNATAYGASPCLRLDLVLNNLVAWAFTTKRIVLTSDGTPWRPLVHVEDIARAFAAVLEAPIEEVHNQVFNVGVTNGNYQVRELAEQVREMIPNTRVEFARHAGPDKRCYQVDCSKINQRIKNYKPQWDVKRGIQELHQSYKGLRICISDFEGPKYKRVDAVKNLISSGRLNASLRRLACEIKTAECDPKNTRERHEIR